KIGIGGNRRLEVAGEHRPAVEGTGEAIDDIARDRLAVRIPALAGFHHMRNQRADLDHLALLGELRQPDARLRGHERLPQFVHAPMVTSTCCLAAKIRPSLIFASTVTVWLSARRMRIENAAFPAIGEN